MVKNEFKTDLFSHCGVVLCSPYMEEVDVHLSPLIEYKHMLVPTIDDWDQDNVDSDEWCWGRFYSLQENYLEKVAYKVRLADDKPNNRRK